MINLALVFGGKSVEHDISIISYFQVLSAIDLKKYNIIPVYFSKSNKIYSSDDFLEMEPFKYDKVSSRYYKEVNFIKQNDKCYLKKKFKKIRIDIVMVIMHGKGLEDGTISGYLKILGVPFTASSVDVSSVLHDKYYTKLAMEKLNINVLDYNLYTKDDLPVNLNGKKIIKACKLGSSIGIKKSEGKEEINNAIYECLKYDERVIVEKCLDKFLELNQAIYIKNGEVVLSDIEEIKVNNHMFSFESKYQNSKCERIVPAIIDQNIIKEINSVSLKIGKNFKVGGVCRIDYLYDLEENILYLNEVNVIPGALAYYLFESKNIYFKDLIDDIINEALRNKYFDEGKISSFTSDVLSSKRVLKK